MARKGKIARLPRPTRDALNLRLESNPPARRLLSWLNDLPEVKSLLEIDFHGKPVNEQNLYQGYKGRFGAFRWPTFWDPGIPGIENYDGSEYRAWASASPLAGLIGTLSSVFQTNGTSKVRLYAHSMGNIVASEALRLMAPATLVHTYVSAQAAVPSHVWDNTTQIMLFPPVTPNVYGYYWQAGVTSSPGAWQLEARPSYMEAMYMPAATNCVNHYNPDDYALNIWQINTELKPDNFYLYTNSEFKRRDGLFSFRILTFPDDRYEIFAWAAQSRGYAVGQQGATGGKFTMSRNLKAPPFNFDGEHKGHSAQFRSTIQKRWSYWQQLLSDFTLPFVP